MAVFRSAIHGLGFPRYGLEMVLNVLHMLGQQVQTVSDDAVGQQDIDRPYKQASQHANNKEPPRHRHRGIHTQQEHKEWEDYTYKDAKSHHPDSEVGEDAFSDSYHIVPLTRNLLLLVIQETGNI